MVKLFNRNENLNLKNQFFEIIEPKNFDTI